MTSKDQDKSSDNNLSRASGQNPFLVALSLYECPKIGKDIRHDLMRLSNGQLEVAAGNFYNGLKLYTSYGIIRPTGFTQHDGREKEYELTVQGETFLEEEDAKYARMIAVYETLNSERNHEVTKDKKKGGKPGKIYRLTSLGAKVLAEDVLRIRNLREKYAEAKKKKAEQSETPSLSEL